MLLRAAMCSGPRREASASWSAVKVMPSGRTVNSTLVAITLRSLRVGWLLVCRYGPVCRRRWFLRQPAAERRFDLAVVQAEGFMEDVAAPLPPPTVRVLRPGLGVAVGG